MATLNIKGFPEALYGKLQQLAERDHRSLAQEVIHLLSGAVERPEPFPAAKPITLEMVQRALDES